MYYLPRDNIFEYYLMNKGKEVLSFTLDADMLKDISIINISLLPEMLKTGSIVAFHEWLKARSIDLSRPNGRLLLKLLQISNNELAPVIFNRAVNLTDTFWIKAKRLD